VNGYLVDTNVVSAFAPGRGEAPIGGAVDRWFEQNEPRLYFSVVTLIELEAGVLALARKSPARRQKLLARWFDGFVERYEDKMLDVDVTVARIAGQVSDRARSLGQHPGMPDVMLAATAIANELTLLSRNLRHFMPLGVEPVDPFDTLPL
jgi:predicted nucleic acid-binding protein